MQTRMQVSALEAQVVPLRSGEVSVSKEDNDALEKVFSDYMTAWQRRKRMFNDAWYAVAALLHTVILRPRTSHMQVNAWTWCSASTVDLARV